MKRTMKCGIGTLALLAFIGCGKDDDNEAQESSGAELAEQTAEIRREQDEQQAELRREQAQKRAELEREQAESQKMNEERADFIQDRREYEAKVQERLSKLDARAQELQTKVASAKTKTKKEVSPHLEAYQTERNQVNTDVSQLDATNKEQWEVTRENVNRKLDALEKHLDNATDKL